MDTSAMSLEKVFDEIMACIDIILADGSQFTNKAAARRTRKATLDLEKLGKRYRQLSIK